MGYEGVAYFGLTLALIDISQLISKPVFNYYSLKITRDCRTHQNIPLMLKNLLKWSIYTSLIASLGGPLIYFIHIISNKFQILQEYNQVLNNYVQIAFLSSALQVCNLLGTAMNSEGINKRKLIPIGHIIQFLTFLTFFLITTVDDSNSLLLGLLISLLVKTLFYISVIINSKFAVRDLNNEA